MHNYEVWYWHNAHNTKQNAYHILDVVAEGYQPRLIKFSSNPSLGELDETGGITITLRKKTEKLLQPTIKLWTQSAEVFGENAILHTFGDRTWGLHAGYWSEPKRAYAGCFKVGNVYNMLTYDNKLLTEKGRNSITTYDRMADTRNAVLNVTVALENDQVPEDFKLVTPKGEVAPINYKLIEPSEYGVFETTYANLSYRLNDVIDYGNDENGDPIAENAVFPDIEVDGNVIAELPGLFNDEIDPKVYEDNITQELKDLIQLSPAKFDVKSMTDVAKTGGNQDKAFERANELNFSLPDPIPFEFQTRTEGNRYYLRGIVSHNFINDVPLVGQANMGMELLGRADEFDAAFDELKGTIRMRPKNRTPRHSSANAFAGLRGYMEGYGEYDPLTHSYEYGINEGAVSVELSASAYVKVPLALLNVGIGVDGVVSATMGMNKPSDEDWKRRVNKAKFDLWLETQLSLDVRADVSAGLDIGIAGVEVGVTGRAGFKNMNKLVLKPYLPSSDSQSFTAGGKFNVYANMYAWAHAYFLFWSWEDEWKIFDVSKTWYYPNNNTNPYLRDAPKLRSVAQSYRRSSLSMPNTIIQDIAANAYPKYFDSGNSLMLSNLKESADQNDDRVSVYSSGNISDMLPESTLPAFGFDVATSANGVSVAAYEQVNEAIGKKSDNISQETYIKTQSNNMDIYAAIKNNGGNWQTTQLSDAGISLSDRKTDMAPKTAVSSDGTKAAVVWRSGFTKVDAAGARVSGNLKLSRYDGTSWSAKPLDLGAADNLADYSLAIDGDSILIAAMRLGTDSIGKIKLIYVSKEDEIKHIETGRIGRKPQIVSTGDNYYVGFMGQSAQNDTTNINDMYLLATTKNGQAIDSISGFAGMTNKVSFAYKLLADHSATAIKDLAILYNATKVVGESEVQTSLYTVKLDKQDGKIIASEPQRLLTVPDEQLIMSFDGYKSGNSIKTVATISNESHGAIVVEEQVMFENKIACLSESFNMAEIKANQDVNVEFEVKNAGFKPVSSLALTIGTGAEQTMVMEIAPGDVQVLRGTTTIPLENTDPVNYSITATFADGSDNTTTGTLDLTAFMMKVDLVSLKNTATENTAVVRIVNNSSTPLTSQYEITVGIYEDIFGEKLYSGTTLKTLPASDLYTDGTAKIATAAFSIPTVDETRSVYAIAKVKKGTSGNLRAATSEAEDVEQAEKNYTSIQLFPIASNSITTNIKTPEATDKKENGLWIYPNPVRTMLHIVDNGQLPKENLKVEIVDINGITVFSQTFSSYQTQLSINVASLTPGIYIVKAGEWTRKFMKE
ncbi:T9SS type A sorting domain-containing protein [Dysgonomonas sp. 520]|uniref:T9SS type A sorting domain-containing protein n=1 Tax=Dysgonomonas sp. 520 TaxID=2302931 RepID=UPI0013D10ED0|nr:T9SS type A sorting domain-containing protein [Dysgonomonas sp. 520]NDW10342.1 T9SS C-terminal target domain-containing protein [Dysgonomonas sp. 520]